MAESLTSPVELSIMCRGSKQSYFSRSCSMVVVYAMDEETQTFRELGRTEVIEKAPNPIFVKKLVVDYHFEECQRLKFEVYRPDNVNASLSKKHLVGECTGNLGQIISLRVFEKYLMKDGKSTRCRIRVKAEEESTCHEQLFLEFRGERLDRKDILGLSDPYLTFSRADEDGGKTLCHRTEVIKATLNPHWKQFRIPLRRLCQGDRQRSIYVECFDWNRNGNHSLIGEFCTNVNQLDRATEGVAEFPLIHPKKQQKKRNYKNSGTIRLLYCKRAIHSFMDYIQGDLELCCSIAIDFTMSNENPKSPTSLHHLNRQRTPTQYAIALEAVGEIIKDYDSDQLFPAFGFGGRFRNNQEVSHSFPLNNDINNPSCSGIENVLAAYYRTLESVRLAGPTNFAPTINKVIVQANDHCDGSKYFILLILTDGVIDDMAETKEAIVQASHLPISIIIVGIGDADFEKMKVLDGDEKRLSSNGRKAARDIVQFVAFRDFQSGRGDLTVIKHALAKAVLEEIPDQLLSYMYEHNIEPRRRRREPRFSTVTIDSGRSSISGPCAGQGPEDPPPPYELC